MITYTKGFTHGGRFHADDVFSTALLMLLEPSFKVERGNIPPTDDSVLVYDIGGGDFDHHQSDTPVRENGIPYAAFGLLWRAYGNTLTANPSLVTAFDTSFVAPLDENDNNGTHHALAAAFAAMNPTWENDDRAASDAAFFEAVAIAKTMLSAAIAHLNAAYKADAAVQEALQTMRHQIVVLPQYMPWEKVLIPTEAKLVIFPSARGGYNLQGVPPQVGSRDVKVFAPMAWRGLEGEALAEASGIQGLRFCHKSGFLAAADTMEAAKNAAARWIAENELRRDAII